MTVENDNLIKITMRRFGRRPTMLVASAIQVVSSILATFSTNYIMFLFLRFFIAFSVSGVFECGFVLGEGGLVPSIRQGFFFVVPILVCSYF